MSSEIADNYLYWRENGSQWDSIYIARKKSYVYYHIQELMLVEYFEHYTPARILEFGCGVGRHLKNLSKIDGIDLYGFDQSQSMIDGIRTWASDEWIDNHIRVGEPVEYLPYPDNFFDIVFTSEVLIHVDPKDLHQILKEILRISKYQIIHFEPSQNYQVVKDVHYGCWNHDLVSIYRDLGFECEALVSGYLCQQPYRVNKSDYDLPYTWSKVQLQIFNTLENNIQPELDSLVHLNTAITRLDEENNSKEEKISQLSNKLKSLEENEKSLKNFTQKLETELEEVQNAKKIAFDNSINAINTIMDGRNYRFGWKIRHSLAFELLRKFRKNRILLSIHALGDKNVYSSGKEVWVLSIRTDEYPKGIPLYSIDFDPKKWNLLVDTNSPTGYVLQTYGNANLTLPVEGPLEIDLLSHKWSGIVKLLLSNGESREIDLYSEHVTKTTINIQNNSFFVNDNKINILTSTSAKKYQTKVQHLGSKDIVINKNNINEQMALAVCHPEWFGIRSSTFQLFDSVLEISDNLSWSNVDTYAKLILDANCPVVVIQGFPLSYRLLIKSLRRSKPDLPIYCIWHGNFMQSDEEYGWEAFRQMVDLQREGYIRRIGFVKKGMSEVIAKTGIEAGFVMNYVREIPNESTPTSADGPHIGIWANAPTWRKLPYAMLSAASLIPNAKVHGISIYPREAEFIKFLGLSAEMRKTPIPQEEMPTHISKMDINLYVTLSECTPMLPLESLSVGVPCLLGPTSHLFEDDPYLFSRLVVKFPERSDTIAEFIITALSERNKIISKYRSYAVGYNQIAREILCEFLDLDPNQIWNKL